MKLREVPKRIIESVVRIVGDDTLRFDTYVQNLTYRMDCILRELYMSNQDSMFLYTRAHTPVEGYAWISVINPAQLNVVVYSSGSDRRSRRRLFYYKVDCSKEILNNTILYYEEEVDSDTPLSELTFPSAAEMSPITIAKGYGMHMLDLALPAY